MTSQVMQTAIVPDTDRAPAYQTTAGQRAPRACQRCRRQKLRCLGGHPCERCVRLEKTCVFSEVQRPSGRKKADPSRSLESSSPTVTRDGRRPDYQTDAEVARKPTTSSTWDSHLTSGMFNFPPAQVTASLQNSTSVRNPGQSIPPPLHTRPLDPPRIGYSIQRPPSPTTTAPTRQDNTYEARPNSVAQNSGPSGFDGDAQLADGGAGARHVRASESLYEAPFRSLLSEVSKCRPRSVVQSLSAF